MQLFSDNVTLAMIIIARTELVNFFIDILFKVVVKVRKITRTFSKMGIFFKLNERGKATGCVFVRKESIYKFCKRTESFIALSPPHFPNNHTNSLLHKAEYLTTSLHRENRT